MFIFTHKMSKRKSVRERGKIKFSRAFQDLKEGDVVAVVREEAKQPRFPKRIQGRTGVVERKQGRALIVRLKDINKEKLYTIDPVHLKRIKQLKKQQ